MTNTNAPLHELIDQYGRLMMVAGTTRLDIEAQAEAREHADGVRRAILLRIEAARREQMTLPAATVLGRLLDGPQRPAITVVTS